MAKKLEYWARIIIIGIVIYAAVYATYTHGSQYRAERTQEVFIEEISSICNVKIVNEDTWEFVDNESLSIDAINSLIEIYYKYDLHYEDSYQYYYMAKPFFGLIQSGIDSLSEGAYIGDKIELNEIQDKVNTIRVQYSLSWRYEDSYMRACAQAIGILCVIIHVIFSLAFYRHS